MIEGIEKYYQIIANAVNHSILEDWKAAKLDAIFYDGSITYHAEYTREEDGKLRSLVTTAESDRAFRDVRKLFKETGKPLWGQACFELEATGRFNMKFGYDNCDENGDTHFDSEVWLKQSEERHKRFIREH